MDLPKKYLSYSALSLWRKNPQEFRNKYYEGILPPETAYTLYGSEIHKKIEAGELLVKDHPLDRYQNEVMITVEIEGIPLMGFLDLFDPKLCAVSDVKTGIRKPDGSARWNYVEVHKLEQLPFYQMMILEKHGKVHPEAKLIWLETAWREEVTAVGFDGHDIEKKVNKLVLTGEQVIFEREIETWEIERQIELLIRDAKAIEKDYNDYRKEHDKQI